MVPLGTIVSLTPVTGPALIQLYNLYPAATIIGTPGAGLQFRRRVEPDVGDCHTRPGPRRRFRLDRDVVSGGSRRPAGLLRVRTGDPAGLSGACRPIRELVRAVVRHPGGTVGAAGTGADPLGAGGRQQHLHPDRPDAADRARRQERDPDRRGGPRAPPPGQGHRCRGDRGVARALPADPDDLVRIYPWRRAAW